MTRPQLRAVPDAGDAVVVCLSCRLDFDGQPDAGHAAYFAGLHNDLHHGSVPVAFAAPVDAPGRFDPNPDGPYGGDAA